MKAIQAKNTTTVKSILAYLPIPTVVVGKILSESSTVPLGVEDLERLNFPLPEDWELLYCILQNTSVKNQADWMQIKTFCKGKTTLSSDVLSTARRSISAGSRPPAGSVDTSLPSIETAAAASSGSPADSVAPLLGETRRRRTTLSSSILVTPRGEHDGVTAPVDSTTAAGTPVAPRKSRLPEGVLSTPPLSDPLAPSVGVARDSLPSARRSRAAPARATSPADPSQGGARRRAPETPRDAPTGAATHVEAASTATPLHTPRAIGGARR